MVKYQNQIKVSTTSKSDPKSKHFSANKYHDAKGLEDFLREQSVGFKYVLIIDPYWEVASLKIIQNVIGAIDSESIFKELRVIKCENNNENHNPNDLRKFISDCPVLKGIKMFDAKKISQRNAKGKDKSVNAFHNRYLVLSNDDDEQENRVFVMSDSLCAGIEHKKALDIAYQSDPEVDRTIKSIVDLYTKNQIYPLVGGKNAK